MGVLSNIYIRSVIGLILIAVFAFKTSPIRIKKVATGKCISLVKDLCDEESEDDAPEKLEKIEDWEYHLPSFSYSLPVPQKIVKSIGGVYLLVLHKEPVSSIHTPPPDIPVV